ncbi:MAG: substrate-binding domain-containing protein [Candidatus Bathyarchaeota archaeon]|nr:substrate-binding domain-containing protein [Candidatus Termiticorpusculum sp.]
MSTPKTIIKVAAAASLKNGLDDIIAAFEGSIGTVKVYVDYAGSYALADIITTMGNTTYDVYLSASDETDLKGMKKVSNAGKILPDVPPVSPPSYSVEFIANDLVLIKNAAWVTNPPTPISGFGNVIKDILGSAHIWIANPDLAPAGEYAKEAFEATTSTTNWTQLLTKATANNTVGPDVQATLNGLINDSTAALGVVYRSDYKNPPSIPLSNAYFVNYAPLDINQKIIYSAAVLTNATSHGVAALAGNFVSSIVTNINTYFLPKGFRLKDPATAHKPGDPI